ncbi:MAG: hypothetical protein IJ730_03250 [Alphaproteobacteria bacterium]|nr:hypothetical protein [Alphaproteobacteria bacterium]
MKEKIASILCVIISMSSCIVNAMDLPNITLLKPNTLFVIRETNQNTEPVKVYPFAIKSIDPSNPAVIDQNQDVKVRVFKVEKKPPVLIYQVPDYSRLRLECGSIAPIIDHEIEINISYDTYNGIKRTRTMKLCYDMMAEEILDVLIAAFRSDITYLEIKYPKED